jgi:hypothetical protein
MHLSGLGAAAPNHFLDSRGDRRSFSISKKDCRTIAVIAGKERRAGGAATAERSLVSTLKHVLSAVMLIGWADQAGNNTHLVADARKCF